jgi:tubulin-specific chaperone C
MAMGELTTAEFLREFDAKISSARSRIEAAETAYEVDSVCSAIDALHVDLSAAVYNLPAYDVRRAQETLGAVAAERQVKSETLNPPKPFRFRRRRQPSTSDVSVGDPGATGFSVEKAGAGGRDEPSLASGESLKVVTIANESRVDGRDCRTFVPGSLRFRDVSMSRLSGMTVQLADVAGAVRAVDLSHCKIYIGPVAGSVHLTNCVGCEIYVAARQVRIHASSQCVFYVLARSSPIIEDCKQLMFAPYAMSYSGLEEQLDEAGLPGTTADMDAIIGDVKDFSWLQEGKSPNWAVLPRDDRPDIKHLSF